jgi:hypothetical protein
MQMRPADQPGRRTIHEEQDKRDPSRVYSKGFVELKSGHYNKDGIEVVDVEGEIDVYGRCGSVDQAVYVRDAQQYDRQDRAEWKTLRRL